LRDWTILDHAHNPLVAGGKPEIIHALKVVWLIHVRWGERSLRNDWRQLRIFARVLRRYRKNPERIMAEVYAFLDDAFLDQPGRYSSGGKTGISATKWPRKALAVELCGEVMSAFPSFRFEELMEMPLAAFWQWLNAARKVKDPEYRNYQETDAVNAQACEQLNRIRQEWRDAVAKN
jgi:hypothetical protein